MECRVDGDDLLRGGATGAFGTVPKESAKLEEPVRAAPEPPPSASATMEPAAAASGGFTQLLRALNYDAVKEVSGAAEGKAAAASSSQVTSFLPAARPAAPEPVRDASGPPAAVPAQGGGSFTQLFRTMEAEVPAKPNVTGAMDGPEKAAGPGTFTQLFAMPETLAVPVSGPERMADQPSAAGSFTQIFDAVRPPSERSVGDAGASEPGSFTRMFEAAVLPRREQAPLPEPVKPDAPVDRQPSAPEPGSFTRMFQTLSEAPTPGGGPGDAPAFPPPAPSSYERPFAASAPEREGAGASQMFPAYSEPRGPVFSSSEVLPVRQPAASAAPASGGITQLLRRLDQPSQASPPPVFAAPTAPQAAPGGSFTGVYGELGTPAGTVAASVPAPMAPAPSASGPSEFTRLINASAVREAVLRGGGAAPAAPPTASPAAASGGGAVPGEFLAGPKPPAAPQLKAPELPKVAAPKLSAPPVGLQQYVPLLLILVIFLLLAILVAVIFLMKK